MRWGSRTRPGDPHPAGNRCLTPEGTTLLQAGTASNRAPFIGPFLEHDGMLLYSRGPELWVSNGTQDAAPAGPRG